MRSVWERAGRPPAGWMAPAAYLLSLTYGLWGAHREHDEWHALADEVVTGRHYAMRGFAEMRLAIHQGDPDALARALARHVDDATNAGDVTPWTGSDIGGWAGYVWALAAESLVVLDRPDATDRLTTVRD